MRGRRQSATFDTKAEAADWAREAETAIVKGLAPPVAAGKMTAAALFDRYRLEVSPGKGGARWERTRLLAFARHPIFLRPMAQIGGAQIADWRDERLQRVSAATVARELKLISAVFTASRKEWRVGPAINPVSDVVRPKSPPSRDRRVSEAERAALVRQLGWDRASAPVGAPQWVAWAFCFALETAMRKGEIVALTWQHVHEDWVHLPRTKNGEPRDVPLWSGARALLALVPRGRPEDRVLGVASGNIDVIFREARAAVGLLDLHFHDARREATTWMAEKLTLLELQMVNGNKSHRNLLVYYKPRASDLAKKLG